MKPDLYQRVAHSFMIVASGSPPRVVGHRTKYPNAAAVHSLAPEKQLGVPEQQDNPLLESVVKVLAVAGALSLVCIDGLAQFEVSQDCIENLKNRRKIGGQKKPKIKPRSDVTVSASDVISRVASSAEGLYTAPPIFKLSRQIEAVLVHGRGPLKPRVQQAQRIIREDRDATVALYEKPFWAAWQGAVAISIFLGEEGLAIKNAASFAIRTPFEGISPDVVSAAYRGVEDDPATILAAHIGPRVGMVELAATHDLIEIAQDLDPTERWSRTTPAIMAKLVKAGVMNSTLAPALFSSDPLSKELLKGGFDRVKMQLE